MSNDFNSIDFIPIDDQASALDATSNSEKVTEIYDVRSLFGELRGFFAYYEEHYKGSKEITGFRPPSFLSMLGLGSVQASLDLPISKGGWRELLLDPNLTIYEAYTLILSQWVEGRRDFLLQQCGSETSETNAVFDLLLDELKNLVLPYCQDHLDTWDLKDCVFDMQSTTPSEVENGLFIFGDGQYPCRTWRLGPNNLVTLSPKQHPLLWARLLAAEGLEVKLAFSLAKADDALIQLLFTSSYRRLLLDANAVENSFWAQFTSQLYSGGGGDEAWCNLEEFVYSGPCPSDYFLSLKMPKLKSFTLLKDTTLSKRRLENSQIIERMLALSPWLSGLESLTLPILVKDDVERLVNWADAQKDRLHKLKEVSPLRELCIPPKYSAFLEKAFDKKTFPLLKIVCLE